MPRKPPSIQGFDSLSDQVFVRDGDLEAVTATKNHPDIVAIYGWGDCLPQHVAKYADGYRAMFPGAKQVVVLSPIAKAMFTSRKQRREHMTPVVNYLFGSPNASESTGVVQGDSRILVHAMSNTGAINFAATLDAYVERFKSPMPHTLFVMDSTPGGTNLTWANLKRWSRAMALGTAKWFPWPFVATQSIWAFFLLLNTLFLWVRRRQHAGAWSRIAAHQEAFATKRARRLYIYSKDDDLIDYRDIENHALESEQLGYAVDTKEFYGSGHVGHMRMHPDEYWPTIQRSWVNANPSEPASGF
ncbi:paxU protein [Cordyceps javanica]|uniref:PaxU protein n=1 Tax=Cordyceps javanica TaxID=43265 RepID=A0A545VQD1_9HYPO|nr:paxU protein [Cordyceps javanica]TQW03943.1 paxU protein [Cordyceps javanica]